MFHGLKRRFLGVALLGLAASASACGTAEPEQDLEARFHSEGDGAVDLAASPRVIATIKTADHATITFVDESGPGGAASVGIEITSSLKTPITDSLLDQSPTALELFQALSPAGSAAPAALLADHAASTSAAPRALVAAAVDGESSGYYDCAATGTWSAAFQAWAPVLDGQYIGFNENGYTTGYVGYAPKFYFDVCRPFDLAAGLVDYYTGVQRRTSSAGTWTTINSNTDALDFQQRRWRYFHSTNTCSSHQYRLVVSSPGPNRYHRAARWADEWSCSIEL